MFFITALYRPGPSLIEWHSGVKDHRCFGFFHKQEDAMQAAQENWLDMHECLYNFLVIEEFEYDGIHPEVVSETWFEWKGPVELNPTNTTNKSDGCWVRVDKPVWSQKIVNWCLG